jgi:hypothetical protein
VPLYEFRNTKLLIESKEDIKKRLGHSPDRADAYVMGLWADSVVESAETATFKMETELNEIERENNSGYDPLCLVRSRR